MEALSIFREAFYALPTFERRLVLGVAAVGAITMIRVLIAGVPRKR